MITKRCSKCGEDKPHRTYFSKSENKIRSQSSCQTCANEYHRQYQADYYKLIKRLKNDKTPTNNRPLITTHTSGA